MSENNSSITSNGKVKRTQVFKLYSDGGARGNPGKAAFGWLIFNEAGDLIAIDAKYLGLMTNNGAEYHGILNALMYFKKQIHQPHLKGSYVLCHLDSELAVKQLNGAYKVKQPELQKIHTRIHKIVSELAPNCQVDFLHVKRENNTLADKLVNICLNANENHKD